MTDNWKEIEKLVHLIEQSINPSSIVLHNQNLPVINSPSGRTRQCDVVIISGTEKRKTTTIVEVQNRNSSVDINTFNGWLEKIKEVGAQHLVCVSMQEFPSSIKEKARQIGSSVMLVKLQQSLEPDTIPLQLINSKATFSDFNIQELFDLNLTYSKACIESTELTAEDLQISHFNINDEIFSINGITLTSIFSISRDILKQQNFNANELHEIEIKDPQEIYVYIKGVFLKVIQLRYKIKWTHNIHVITPSVMTYDQIEDGTLAWVLEYKFNNGIKSMSVKLPFTGSSDSVQLSQFLIDSSHDLSIAIEKKVKIDNKT